MASNRNSRLNLFSGDDETPETLKPEHRSPFEIEMEHFLYCIKNNSEARTSGIEERNILAVIKAGHQSIREDLAIKVNMRKS